MGGCTTGEMPVFMMSLYCWVCYKLVVKSKQFNKVEQPALVYPSLTLIFNSLKHKQNILMVLKQIQPSFYKKQENNPYVSHRKYTKKEFIYRYGHT